MKITITDIDYNIPKGITDDLGAAAIRAQEHFRLADVVAESGIFNGSHFRIASSRGQVDFESITNEEFYGAYLANILGDCYKGKSFRLSVPMYVYLLCNESIFGLPPYEKMQSILDAPTENHNDKCAVTDESGNDASQQFFKLYPKCESMINEVNEWIATL